jgi:hypothetical protein
MKPQSEPSTQEVLAGLVERVTYHNAENGFCVLRAKARGHRDVVTVVGHAATIAAGEWVTAALLTGCRFRELAALATEDFNTDAGTITIRTSKSGKPRHVVLTDEGREFFACDRTPAPIHLSSPKRMINPGRHPINNAPSPPPGPPHG